MTDFLQNPQAGQRKVQTFKFSAVAIVAILLLNVVAVVVTKGTVDSNIFMVGIAAIGGTKMTLDGANALEHKSKNAGSSPEKV